MVGWLNPEPYKSFDSDESRSEPDHVFACFAEFVPPPNKTSSIIRVQGLGTLAPAFENHMEEKNMDNEMEAGAEK